MTKRRGPKADNRPAPVTAEDLEMYAESLVRRGLCSPLILTGGREPRWRFRPRSYEAKDVEVAS